MNKENIQLRGQGALETFVGNIKSGFGRLMGNPGLEERGRAEAQQGREHLDRPVTSGHGEERQQRPN
jgi:uncharacterized protein YjbJ (UPF0337 family)